jgi:hypothetical protein
MKASIRRNLMTVAVVTTVGWSGMALAAEQVTTPNPTSQSKSPGDAISFTVNYSTTNPNNPNLTGLGLRVHFNSSKVTFVGLTNVLQAGLQGVGTPQADTQDFDNDPLTDQFVLVAWVDFNGHWPGTEPAQLFTASFTAAANFTGSTTVRFTASSTAAGYTLAATPATVSLATTSPNLTPYQPPGWSDKIVVATAAGVTTDSSPLIPSDTLYVSWGAINNGNVSIPASPNYWFYVYLDGNPWVSGYADFALNPNTYLYVPDIPLGSLSPGAHTLRLVCDATNVVVESNEGDNEYTKTIMVGAAARFFTATPCRVLDTRNPTGPLGAPPLQPGATRTFDPSASTCSIPTDAVAISANLTVTNVGAPGELVVFPSDVLRPNTSALSFRAGRTRANNAIVSFSKSSTTFSIFNNSAATVDFILDVNGYFR